MKPSGIHIVGEFKGCSIEILNSRDKLEQIIYEAITNSGMTMVRIASHQFEPVGATVTAIISESHVVVHTYPESQHASLDIFTCTYNPEPPRKLFNHLKKELKAKEVKHIELIRGDILDKKQTNLLTTTAGNGFEIRYQIDKIIYTKKTDYQQLDIFENNVFGKMLFLDNDLQIAESDAFIYNDAMVDPVINIERLDNSLILGGGDGGIANKLLNKTDCTITLVDIDKQVIEACKTHMPEIEGNAFNDKRVTVINQDAETFLKSCCKYDAVFYDLSMNPETFSIKDKKTYMQDLFSSLKKCLNKNGMLSMQCCSAFDIDTLNMVKEILSMYFSKEICFKEVYIPSFCEPWVFASLSY